MTIRYNALLTPYNTFGLPARAVRLVEIESEQELVQFIQKNKEPLRVLGGGSNLLLSKDVEETLLLNQIKGRSIIREDASSLVSFGGGENWHEAVLFALENNLGGIENLSLIPGTVGASPIQNIGAYGVELKDVFEELRAVDLQSGESFLFRAEDMRFGYRDSIFKQELRGKMMITGVTLRLHHDLHRVRTDYGAIQRTLSERGIDHPSIHEVSRAVIDIRRSKLPDPKVLGNSGSFFKNPVLTPEQFGELQNRIAEPVHYALPDGRYKVPAGWLIDRAGWRGKRQGNVGTYEHQALVLVNHGKATGPEVWALAQAIQQDVLNKFGIALEPEVNVW